MFTAAVPTRTDRNPSSLRFALAADLHRAGLATACEAVGRDLTALAPAIVRELRTANREDLVAAVLAWESSITGVDLATLTALAAPTGAA